MQHAFKLYDLDKNGTMNAQEFKQVLVDLGKRDVTDDQVKTMLSEVDKNSDSVIQWDEFVEVLIQIYTFRCSSNLRSPIRTVSERSSQSRPGTFINVHIYIVRYLNIQADLVSPTRSWLRRRFASRS